MEINWLRTSRKSRNLGWSQTGGKGNFPASACWNLLELYKVIGLWPRCCPSSFRDHSIRGFYDANVGCTWRKPSRGSAEATKESFWNVSYSGLLLWRVVIVVVVVLRFLFVFLFSFWSWFLHLFWTSWGNAHVQHRCKTCSFASGFLLKK